MLPARPVYWNAPRPALGHGELEALGWALELNPSHQGQPARSGDPLCLVQSHSLVLARQDPAARTAMGRELLFEAFWCLGSYREGSDAGDLSLWVPGAPARLELCCQQRPMKRPMPGLLAPHGSSRTPRPVQLTPHGLSCTIHRTQLIPHGSLHTGCSG